MAKRKGGLKIRQKGMVREDAKKSHHKGGKSPWADPLTEFTRGGGRH